MPIHVLKAASLPSSNPLHNTCTKWNRNPAQQIVYLAIEPYNAFTKGGQSAKALLRAKPQKTFNKSVF